MLPESEGKPKTDRGDLDSSKQRRLLLSCCDWSAESMRFLRLSDSTGMPQGFGRPWTDLCESDRKT